MAEIAVLPRRRWLRVPPELFAAGLVLAVGLLSLSERFSWFGFDHHKGWPVLIALAAVVAWMAALLLFWLAALAFRRRCQFSLRSLLLFVVAASIACSWLAVELRSARRQAAAILAITNAGGQAQYSWCYTDDSFSQESHNTQPPAPDWLVRVLGVDFFSTVGLVDLGNCNPTADWLKKVPDLHGVSQVWLNGRTDADAVLEQLTGAAGLRYVNLDYSQVSDNGLKHLDGLPSLAILDVVHTSISDEGLRNLQECHQIHGLTLSETKITDVGVRYLGVFSELSWLSLDHTQITDAGVKQLKVLSQLENLSLIGTHVTGAGVERLKDLPKLASLDLDGTDITDADVDCLKPLSRLKKLTLQETRVTASGLKMLRASLPKCLIYH